MAHPGKKSGKVVTIIVTILCLFIALFAARFAAFESFKMSSDSMLPMLSANDRAFVSKSAYGYSRHSFPFNLPIFEGRILASEPERGDVVVFKLPSDDRLPYLKRVIGLPGDRIQIIQGQLVINDSVVENRPIEDFSYQDNHGNVHTQKQFVETLPNGRQYRIIHEKDEKRFPLYYNDSRVFVVPSGHYFVLGDNRDNSLDSRDMERVGFVPNVNLIGRVNDSVAGFWGKVLEILL